MEYKERFPEGYQHSQFCEYYNRWAKTLEVSLRQEHRAGEKMFIDFAGKRIPGTNPSTGEVSKAQIFMAVPRASNYTHAEALPSQSLPFWIRVHIHAFEYFHQEASTAWTSLFVCSFQAEGLFFHNKKIETGTGARISSGMRTEQ
jgi:transposase